MRLNYNDYLIDISICENEVTLLSIESTEAMRNMVKNLWIQLQGEDGGWKIYENEKEIKISKYCELITNPFSVNINDKKILSGLYNEIITASEEQCVKDIYSLYNQINLLIDNMTSHVPYLTEYDNEIPLDMLLKTTNVRITSDYEDDISLFADYICLKNKICGTNIFFISNIKQFYSEDQLRLLYEKLLYEKIIIIILEGIASQPIQPFEKQWILDKDLCIIKPN